MKVGEYIFVYGTLRPGQYAGDFMRGMSKRVSITHLYGAKLLNIGGRFPGMILTPDEPDFFVVGDLFLITEDAETLTRKLDAYEGCPTLYSRVQIQLGGCQAWSYTFNNPIGASYPVLTNGDWARRDKAHMSVSEADKAKFDPL